MFCIHIKKTLSSGISLEYLTTPLIALHNIGWEKKFYLIVTEMSSWQMSKKKNATEQARKASKHLTVLGHLDWATSVMLSLKQSQYIQQALKRKWLPSLTHLIYHSGSAKCPKTSWKLTIHQFLDLKHNHLALND